MRDNDHVFTVPLRMTQSPPHSSEWNVITSSIDRPSSTISVLYGDSVAVRYARSHARHDYPPGAELSLVTWALHDDMHWFGANLPGRLKSVESVHVATGPDTPFTSAYELCEGSRLVRTSVFDERSAGGREVAVLALRAAVIP